jgi:hypothetical protein
MGRHFSELEIVQPSKGNGHRKWRKVTKYIQVVSVMTFRSHRLKQMEASVRLTLDDEIYTNIRPRNLK